MSMKGTVILIQYKLLYNTSYTSYTIQYKLYNTIQATAVQNTPISSIFEESSVCSGCETHVNIAETAVTPGLCHVWTASVAASSCAL